MTVFRRAYGLGALLQRWEFEQTIQGFDEMSIVEIHKGMAADLGRWIEAEGLHTCLSNAERGLLALPLGRWQTDLIEAVSWRLEPLGIFAWAVSLIKTLPPYDRRFSHDDLLVRLRIGKPLQMPHTLRLRSDRELQAAYQTAQLWEWRVQQIGSNTTPIEAKAAKGWKDGLLPKPVDRDFPAFDRAYASLSRQQSELLTAISEQRVAAFRWLYGQ
jgi:hypothetical protein